MEDSATPSQPSVLSTLSTSTLPPGSNCQVGLQLPPPNTLHPSLCQAPASRQGNDAGAHDHRHGPDSRRLSPSPASRPNPGRGGASAPHRCPLGRGGGWSCPDYTPGSPLAPYGPPRPPRCSRRGGTDPAHAPSWVQCSGRPPPDGGRTRIMHTKNRARNGHPFGHRDVADCEAPHPDPFPPPGATPPRAASSSRGRAIILYGPGHKPLLVLLNPYTTLDDIGNILRYRGSPMPPTAEIWAGNRRVTRGPPLLAQHVCAGMTLAIRLPLLGGTWPGGASIRRATPVVPQSKDHPMSRGPTPPHGVISRKTRAPSAAETLLQPSNTDWCPLHEAPHGEPRNLLLVPTGGLIRCDDGWGVTARCAFGRASPEVTLRASFPVPPHMAGSLLNTCITCRSAICRSDTLVMVSTPGSVASIRDAPLLHAVCPQLFPAMPSLSSDIRRLCRRRWVCLGL